MSHHTLLRNRYCSVCSAGPLRSARCAAMTRLDVVGDAIRPDARAKSALNMSRSGRRGRGGGFLHVVEVVRHARPSRCGTTCVPARIPAQPPKAPANRRRRKSVRAKTSRRSQAAVRRFQTKAPSPRSGFLESRENACSGSLAPAVSIEARPVGAAYSRAGSPPHSAARRSRRQAARSCSPRPCHVQRGSGRPPITGSGPKQKSQSFHVVC